MMPIINWSLIAPEVIVCIAAVVVMLVDAFVRPTQRWITGTISLVGIVAGAAATLWLWSTGTVTADAFNGMIVLDELRLGFTLIFLLVSGLTLLISTVWVDNENLPAGEFHSLLLFATVGMMLMASGNAALMSFSPLTSARTLSATIAAELGEVVFGGGHYRILFFLGTLLFVVTSLLNWVGDYYNRRMRRKLFGTE